MQSVSSDLSERPPRQPFMLRTVAQWLACALPYRRFVDALTDGNARLGADAVRYSFIVADFHHLLLAGLTGALSSYFTNGRGRCGCSVGRCVPQPAVSMRNKRRVRKAWNLLEYLVGLGEQRRWDSEPERLCGLEIDRQFKFRRLLDW